MNPITPIIEIGSKLIDRIFPDPQQRAQAQLELLKMEQSGEIARMTEQSKVIVAEAQSESWLARNWRPLAMMNFIIIIFNNYILAQWLKTFGFPVVIMDIPPKMWDLLEIGLGGYIFMRSAEKAIKIWKS